MMPRSYSSHHISNELVTLLMYIGFKEMHSWCVCVRLDRKVIDSDYNSEDEWGGRVKGSRQSPPTPPPPYTITTTTTTAASHSIGHSRGNICRDLSSLRGLEGEMRGSGNWREDRDIQREWEEWRRKRRNGENEGGKGKNEGGGTAMEGGYGLCEVGKKKYFNGVRWGEEDTGRSEGT